jgi:hypothetical protein
MAGLDPAIHVLLYVKNVDARDKPGHDEKTHIAASGINTQAPSGR